MTLALYAGCIIVALFILEPLLPDWFDLQQKRINLFFARLVMKARLEWDIYWIANNKKKYLRMAEELRKELGLDDAPY